MKDLIPICEQLLPVVAYGDAAGLPHEGGRPEQIGDVSGLRDTFINPYIGEYPAGTWSDDTHLSLVVARSLLRGFDLERIARDHVDALRHVHGATDIQDLVPPIVTTEKQNGWGASTTRAIGRLAAGISPLDSGEDKGAGNGVLMKMGPLVAWQGAHDISTDEREEQIVALTRMTHAAPEAIVASLTHMTMLNCLLQRDSDLPLGASGFLRMASGAASAFEKRIEARSVLSEMLHSLQVKREISALKPSDILGKKPIRGFYAPETLVMAYGSFTRETRFPDSVYRAVELGGDADSIGSIVGTMSLFLAGEVQFPADYELVFEHERLERLSHQLAATCMSLEQS